jgi:hypothetical protein
MDWFQLQLASSGAAVACSKILIAPFDRLKILRQCGILHNRLFPLKSWYNGFFTHMSQLSLANLIKVSFVTTNLNHNQSNGIFYPVACFIASLIVYPLDVRYLTKTVSPHVSPSSIIPYYKGIHYTMASIPLYLITVTSAIHYISSTRNDSKDPSTSIFIGGVSSVLGTAISYPIETSRKRYILNLPHPNKILQYYGGFGIYLFKTVPEYFVLSLIYQQILSSNHL